MSIPNQNTARLVFMDGVSGSNCIELICELDYGVTNELEALG
jgi:hypothetical protein